MRRRQHIHTIPHKTTDNTTYDYIQYYIRLHTIPHTALYNNTCDGVRTYIQYHTRPTNKKVVLNVYSDAVLCGVVCAYYMWCCMCVLHGMLSIFWHVRIYIQYHTRLSHAHIARKAVWRPTQRQRRARCQRLSVCLVYSTGWYGSCRLYDRHQTLSHGTHSHGVFYVCSLCV